MIRSKADLQEYLQADKFAMNRTARRPPFYDYEWRYLVVLRKYEYWQNGGKGLWGKLFTTWYKLRWHQLGVKCCGFMVGPNTCGKGLSLAHLGPIIVNEGARLGEWCRLHVCITIGTAAGAASDSCTIGDRVYIGPGARLFGNITIASDIAIGANSVVTKSFSEPGVTIAGVPAKKVAEDGSRGLILVPGVTETAPEHRPHRMQESAHEEQDG